MIETTDALTYLNYGIPDEPCSGGLGASLSVLRDEFAARGRCPRIEFIQEFAPQLACALRAAGFVEEARQQLMVCTAETYRLAPEVLGLTITELTCNLNRPGRPALPASAASEVQDYLNTQRRGFDARSAPPPPPASGGGRGGRAMQSSFFERSGEEGHSWDG